MSHYMYLLFIVLVDYYIALRGCGRCLRFGIVGDVCGHVQLFTCESDQGCSQYSVSTRYLVSLHVLTQKFLATSDWLNHHRGIHILQQKCTNTHVDLNIILF